MAPVPPGFTAFHKACAHVAFVNGTPSIVVPNGFASHFCVVLNNFIPLLYSPTYNDIVDTTKVINMSRRIYIKISI